MEKLYYIQREGVYFQGVCYISSDLGSCFRKVKELKASDWDNHHDYKVFEYIEEFHKGINRWSGYLTQDPTPILEEDYLR